MKRKLIIFVIFFLLFVGIIILSFISKPKTQITNNQPPQVPPVRTPQISTFYPDKGVIFKINVESFNPPDELSLIKISPPKPLTEEEVKQIAKTAGLDESNFKTIINGANQKLYIFNSNNAYLTTYADTGQVSYRNYQGVSDSTATLSEEKIISKAKDFLVNKFSFKADNLNLSSINHSTNDEYTLITGKAQPQGYYEVNFAPVLTDYKVVTTSPEQSPIRVTIADDGTVGKADITLIYQASLLPEKYAIKSFKDLKDQINKAVIVEAHSEGYHGQYFPANSIISIDIDHIEIAYLADSSTKNNYYQPVFLLQGTGKSSIVPGSINVTLYLPALKYQL